MRSPSDGSPTDKARDHRITILVAIIGAVGVVVAAIAPKLLDRRSSPPDAQATRPAPQGAPVAKAAPITIPAPDTSTIERNAIAVWHTLDTLPPLRRNAIATAVFVGRPVEWAGVVDSVARHSHGFVVGVRRRGARATLFYVVVDSGQYGLVSTLRIDDSITVRGRISRVDWDNGLWVDHAAIARHSR
jgi:hypothetical protein